MFPHDGSTLCCCRFYTTFACLPIASSFFSPAFKKTLIFMASKACASRPTLEESTARARRETQNHKIVHDFVLNAKYVPRQNCENAFQLCVRFGVAPREQQLRWNRLATHFACFTQVSSAAGCWAATQAAALGESEKSTNLIGDDGKQLSSSCKWKRQAKINQERQKRSRRAFFTDLWRQSKCWSL